MLYQFTYNSKLPQNLCPYFWKLVLALVLFIPYLIIKLPSYIENLFAKDYRETYEHLGCGLALYFTGLCLFIIGLVEYQWIKVIFHCYSYECELANCGAIVFFCMSNDFNIIFYNSKSNG